MAKTFDGPPTLERSGSEHRRAITSFLLRFLPPTRGTEGVVKTIEERLGEKGGAFFNGKEGRDDFSIKLRKESKIREIRVQKSTSIIVFRSRPGPSSRRGFLTPSLLASSPPSLSRPQ